MDVRREGAHPSSPELTPPVETGALRQRFLRSHLIVAAVGLAMLLVATASTVFLRSYSLRLATLRGPAARLSTLALSGIERSLAGLRGWVAVGDPRFRQDRAQAWNAQIRPAMVELNTLLAREIHPEDQARLMELNGLLEELEEAQWWVEDVAQTPGNQPARGMLERHVRPIADGLAGHLSAMLDEEKRQTSSPERKLLLSWMADVQGHFLFCLARLESFVVEARTWDEMQLQSFLALARDRLKDLVARVDRLSPVQRELLDDLQKEFLLFEIAANDAIEVRKQQHANVAQYRMVTETIPRARRATTLLTAISEHQAQLMQVDAARVVRISDASIWLLLVLIGVMAASALWISRRGAERIVQPISTLAWAARQLAAGRLQGDIPVTSHDEVGELTQSFNTMRAALQTAEQQLAEKAEALARSNKELEQFAYVASHDLQEPLRKVSSYTELLAKRYAGRLDANADKFIHYIVDGATRMQILIQDLLTYSRVGRAELVLQPTDLSVIVEQVVADLEQAIHDTGVTVTTRNLPTVMVNPKQMTQVFQNLISNGIKYHGSEPPRIEIAATQRDQEWVVAVRDNGIGFDPQNAERIFQIFQRLHTRAEYSGTGIGLAICKMSVERHGGRIWAESQPGQGATFSFTLPVRPINDREEG